MVFSGMDLYDGLESKDNMVSFCFKIYIYYKEYGDYLYVTFGHC